MSKAEAFVIVRYDGGGILFALDRFTLEQNKEVLHHPGSPTWGVKSLSGSVTMKIEGVSVPIHALKIRDIPDAVSLLHDDLGLDKIRQLAMVALSLEDVVPSPVSLRGALALWKEVSRSVWGTDWHDVPEDRKEVLKAYRKFLKHQL
jgi:hypothetical protein